MSRRNSRAVVTTREESFYELVGPFSSLISGIWLRARSVDVGRYQGLIAGHPSPRQLGRNDIQTANVSHSDQPHKSRRRACDVPLENTRLWITWTDSLSFQRVRPRNGLNPFCKCHPLCQPLKNRTSRYVSDTNFSQFQFNSFVRWPNPNYIENIHFQILLKILRITTLIIVMMIMIRMIITI